MSRLDHIAKRQATYDDVLAAPPNMVAELINGTLFLQPRPAPRHARAYSGLTTKIGGPFDYDGGPGGWIILAEPELHLGEQIIVPDVAGWRRDRMPALPDEAFFTTPPDWVCEILSPSTRTRDLTAKRDIYRDVGVGHLWFVDPDAQTLEAFRSTPEGWVLDATLADDDTVELAPFAAAPFGLGVLWMPKAE